MQKEKKQSKFGFSLAFSTRGIGMAMETVLLLQVTYYATEIVGINIGLLGVVFLALKLLDGVTDILMGFIIDKTHTKWGKARPYELFMIPLGILTVALFSVPNSIGMTGKLVYVAVLYALISTVCQTALNTSENVYLIRSTRDESYRASAQAIQGVLAMIIPGIVGVILPFLMNSWGKQPGGWTKIALVIAVPSTFLGILRLFLLKEMDDAEETTSTVQELTFGLAIKTLFGNKYCLLVALALCMTAIMNQLGSSIGSYYFTWVVGDLSKMGIVSLLSLIGPIFIIFFPMGMRKIGAANFIKLGLVIAMVGNILKIIAGANMPLLLVGNFLSNVGSGVIVMVSAIFVGQCIDYGEWINGTRVEGVLNCVVGFAKKIGQGVSSAMIGMLAWFGYVSGAAVQTPMSIMAIRALYGAVPLVLCILTFLVMSKYDLEKQIPQIRKDLEERRQHAE